MSYANATKKASYEWSPGKMERFDAGTAAVLAKLNNFGFAIGHQPFDKVIATILPRGIKTGTTIERVSRIADALRENRGENEPDVLGKSIRETLYWMGDFDLNQMSFERNVRTFVRKSGGKGVIQLFLELHLSNLIWRQLYSSSRMPRDIETLETLPDGINRLCRQVVKATTGSWKKWPQLDEDSAKQVLRSLREQMSDTLAEPSAYLLKKAG